MTGALNYSTKAFEAFSGYLETSMPLSRAGFKYLAEKLRQAEVFILPDHGELLDRGRPRPEVPGLVFKPPYPVVAVEYPSTPDTARRDHPIYTASHCSRRISLAWDWTDDAPRELLPAGRPHYGSGVVIASIAYYDAQDMWIPIAGAFHLPYDAEWVDVPKDDPLRSELIDVQRITKAQAAAKAMNGSFIPILPEALFGMIKALGPDEMTQHVRADLMDEVNAYCDLCTALACKNVSTERQSAPTALNRSRLKTGKSALKDFHILKLHGEEAQPFVGASGGGSSPRPHLRRGHIRRLDADRITWVNQTMVRGRGSFASKVYAL